MEKILYMAQEMEPFVPENDLSEFTKIAAQVMHNNENEVRVFMPRYGCINERKHQLHEVIRLSGINIYFNNIQHELLVKVATLPKSKIQTYFINNSIFFSDRVVLQDDEDQYFPNNDEKAIFFAKSTLETLQRLAWKPAVIHLHGWFCVLLGLYLKTEFKDNPFFKGTKLVYSIYPSDFQTQFPLDFEKKILGGKLRANHLKQLPKTGVGQADLHRLGIEYADAVIFIEQTDPDLLAFAQENKKIIAEHPLSWMRKIDQIRELYTQMYQDLKSQNKIRKKKEEL